MNRHCAIVEAGPGSIRRLCCTAAALTGEDMPEVIRAALDAVDDRIALIDGRPAAVQSLWRTALAAAARDHDGMIVVHPSWWSSSRVDTLAAAATTLTVDMVLRPRSWLLARAAPAGSEVTSMVEIAERLLAITVGTRTAAISRRADPVLVAEEAAAVMARHGTSDVVIDAANGVPGAAALATSIAAAVRAEGRAIVQVDADRLTRLARSTLPPPGQPPEPRRAARTRPRARMLGGLGAAAAVLAAAVPAVAALGQREASPAPTPVAVPSTFLVEGRVAVAVPANWPTQRLLAGPGSARVQITSPSDPEVALHVTQSPVGGETLAGSADRLRRAIDGEPPGVFVDFDPSGVSAGRPAVTYREVRAGHQVRWTVLLDGPVRISIGRQSRPGGEDAIRPACEQAVRSAHAVG